jgi:hypothetical protein
MSGKKQLDRMVSGSDLAAMFGLSKSRITRLRDAGVLKQTAPRQYGLVASVRGYVRFLKNGKASAKVASAREGLLIQQQRRLRIQNDQREGKLLPLDEYNDATMEMIALLIQHLNEIPGHCAALVEKDDPATIKEAARQVIHRARNAMANAMEAFAKQKIEGGAA